MWRAVESEQRFKTGVLLGNTSEQSEDCSYDLLGLYILWVLGPCAPLGQAGVGETGGSKDSSQ